MTESPRIVTLASAKPDPEVVDRLRDLLEKAESGELRAIAFCAEMRDESCITGFTKCRDAFARLAHVHRLAHRLQLSMDGE